MSRSHQEEVRCSRCNALQSFTVWESINVTVDPELKKSLLDGELTTFRCKLCGNEAHVSYDCLYHDMGKSIAIWLKEVESAENELAKSIFLTATNIKTTRTVRTIHELLDKIKIFDDGFSDFEIELFKFSMCIRQQIDLCLPFHYSETHTSLFGRKTLVFVVARGGEYESLSCLANDYEASVLPFANMVRPLVPDSAFEWAKLDRSFILHFLEKGGLMQSITPTEQ